MARRAGLVPSRERDRPCQPKGLIRNPDFTFNGRNRRPPRDPVNALLSFVYTLLTNEVQSAITAGGLDPYLGALHEIDYGRPSLACDLVEEYRAFLGDRMVLGLINRKTISPDDFVYRKNPPAEYADEAEMKARRPVEMKARRPVEMKARRPVEMKPGTCRAFIAAYEAQMAQTVTYPPLEKTITYRWLIMNQVRRFGEFLENPDTAYQPFVWEI